VLILGNMLYLLPYPRAPPPPSPRVLLPPSQQAPRLRLPPSPRAPMPPLPQVLPPLLPLPRLPALPLPRRVHTNFEFWQSPSQNTTKTLLPKYTKYFLGCDESCYIPHFAPVIIRFPCWTPPPAPAWRTCFPFGTVSVGGTERKEQHITHRLSYSHHE